MNDTPEPRSPSTAPPWQGRGRGRSWPGDTGSTATEYALIASMIAVVIAAAVGLVGGEVNALFLKVFNAIN